MLDLKLHDKVKLCDIAEYRPSHGLKQAAWVSWKEFPVGACLLLPGHISRAEFGPGTFRTAPGELHYELIVKLDPARFELYFVNNKLYEESSIIEWEPVKLKELRIFNMKLFLTAFTSSWMDLQEVLIK